MAYIPAQTYRVTDPIENLQLCVTLRKRATEGQRKLKASAEDAPSKLGRRKSITRLGRPGSSDDDADDDDNDAEGAEARLLEKEEEEELLCPPRTFRWQEKAFSREEVRQINKLEDNAGRPRRNSMSGFVSQSMKGGLVSSTGDAASALSNHHRAELERLRRSALSKGERHYEGEAIYTRVHSERFATEWTHKFTDSQNEHVTPLARAVLEGVYVREHRDMLGEAACVSMHVLATLPLDKDKERQRQARASLGGQLAASTRSLLTLGAEESDPTEEEVVLCELRLYPLGRLDIRPPLSYDDDAEAPPSPATALDEPPVRLARWYSVPGTRYEYKLENLAEAVGAREQEQEATAERLAKLSVTAAPRAVSDFNFDVPPRKLARVHYFIELESASHFDTNALYVAYYALAAPGWKLLPHCVASAVTQTSYVSGADGRAVLGFPIELSLESEGPPTAARPPLSLFFSVVSRDVHERMTQLGYCHLAPHPAAGMSETSVQAWRLAEDRSDKLRRFFVGGTEELADLRAIALPDGFDIATQPQCLNKHGLQTVTTGTLRLKLHIVVQQHQPPAYKGPVRAAAASNRPTFTRGAPDFGAVRGAAAISSLSRAPTNADKVIKRLEERRRAEGK